MLHGPEKVPHRVLANHRLLNFIEITTLVPFSTATRHFTHLPFWEDSTNNIRYHELYRVPPLLMARLNPYKPRNSRLKFLPAKCRFGR
jgi:hypothetical protein